MSILPMDMVPITFGFVKDVRVTRLWSSSTVSCWLSFNQPTDIGYRLEWNYPFQPCRPSFYNFSFGCAVSFFTAVHSCEKHPAFLSDPVSAFPYGHFFTPSFSGADTAATLSCVSCPCSIRIGMTLFDSILLMNAVLFLLPRQATLEKSGLSVFFVAVREGASIPAPESGHELLPAVPSLLVLIFHHCFSNEAIIIFPLQR